MFAAAVGNHEYYEATRSAMVSNEWFLAAAGNPENLPGASYWFLYNKVLFICIDNVDTSFTHEQQTAAGAAIAANTGKYNYIIIYKHYPDFTTQNTEDKSSNEMYYTSWRSFYDDYEVDFVLSGHHHQYVRTERLYHDEVSTDPQHGTVYITLCPIDSGISTFTEKTNTNTFIAKAANGPTAACRFKVTPDNITFCLYSLTAAETPVMEKYDEVTINAKP
jgi:hypothetical protein